MALVPYGGGTGSSLSTPVPMLTGGNYTTWAIKVEANLDAAGLWEAVVLPEDAAAAVIAKRTSRSGHICSGRWRRISCCRSRPRKRRLRSGRA
ncbi:retrotransposon protein [Hordeum vulgare]|nr:retrotransposon protein [Hordeum vulgare]